VDGDEHAIVICDKKGDGEAFGYLRTVRTTQGFYQIFMLLFNLTSRAQSGHCANKLCIRAALSPRKKTLSVQGYTTAPTSSTLLVLTKSAYGNQWNHLVLLIKSPVFQDHTPSQS